MANASLEAIRIKVRRLTRTPSLSQMSNTQLDEYINTFIEYDMPSSLRLFNLRQTLTFYTQPGVAEYETNTTTPDDPLFDFKNRYMAVHEPVFVGGKQINYTQQRRVFYALWPQTNSVITLIPQGNNSVGPFTTNVRQALQGSSSYPYIMQRSVNINCVDGIGTSMILRDIPINNIFGNLRTADVPLTPPFETTVDPNNNINYVTGDITFTFDDNTQTGAPIYFEGILYQPGWPISMLYYADRFILRPVPDKTYAVNIEVDVVPTELLATNDIPDLNQWWQYIAYGAAKKVFEDRMDTQSIQQIMPEFKNQEEMVLSRTLEQQATQRPPTIYTTGKSWGSPWFNTGWPY